jgi:hypothetical protein
VAATIQKSEASSPTPAQWQRLDRLNARIRKIDAMRLEASAARAAEVREMLDGAPKGTQRDIAERSEVSTAAVSSWLAQYPE